jgi:hypothetical protein
VTDPVEVCHRAFELTHVGAVVREPPAIQDVLDSRQESLPIPDVRATDVKGFTESRDAAAYGKLSRGVLQVLSPANGSSLLP